MKEYKIDLSMYDGKVLDVVGRAVDAQCHRMAFGSPKKSEEPFPWKYVYVKDRCIEKTTDTSMRNFEKHPAEEISAADFLALKPEDVKDAPGFKPFDKVLVRDDDRDEWRCDFFEYFDESEDSLCGFQCLQNYWEQCIPYEGNEHLLGTREDV